MFAVGEFLREGDVRGKDGRWRGGRKRDFFSLRRAGRIFRVCFWPFGSQAPARGSSLVLSAVLATPDTYGAPVIGCATWETWAGESALVRFRVSGHSAPVRLLTAWGLGR